MPLKTDADSKFLCNIMPLHKNVHFLWNYFNWGMPFSWGSSPCSSVVKNLPAKQKTWVWSLGWEYPLEKKMAIHSSILAWRISWTEETGGLQSMGSQSQTRCSNWASMLTALSCLCPKHLIELLLLNIKLPGMCLLLWNARLENFKHCYENIAIFSLTQVLIINRAKTFQRTIFATFHHLSLIFLMKRRMVTPKLIKLRELGEDSYFLTSHIILIDNQLTWKTFVLVQGYCMKSKPLIYKHIFQDKGRAY